MSATTADSVADPADCPTVVPVPRPGARGGSAGPSSRGSLWSRRPSGTVGLVASTTSTSLRESTTRGDFVLYGALWLVADICLVISVGRVGLYGLFGVDARAYWLAWHGPMYTTGPATLNAYLYSPAFAQAVWPLAHLPSPAIGAALIVANAALLFWLIRPVGWGVGVPVFLVLSPEVMSGNIFIPLAVMAVFGFRYPGAWAFSTLTKVAPTVMPVWWVVRREWRPLAIWAGTTAVVVVVSVAISPDLWLQWVTNLIHWANDSTSTLGTGGMVPLIYRAPVGLALVAYGARMGWRWTVPVGMLLCTPFFWLGSYAVLAAIPRINQK